MRQQCGGRVEALFVSDELEEAGESDLIRDVLGKLDGPAVELGLEGSAENQSVVLLHLTDFLGPVGVIAGHFG